MLKSRFVITLVSVAVGVAASVACVGYHLSAATDRRPPLAPVVAPVESPFAVLELFTSEGCSSCPPADQLLVEMAERSREPGSRLYPLTFHVDYWDRLGWPDRFADELWSERQRRYALASQGANVGLWDWDIGNGEMFYSERWKHKHMRTTDRCRSDLGYSRHWDDRCGTMRGPPALGATPPETARR